MAEAVGNASDMVAMACELEAYRRREGDDQYRPAPRKAPVTHALETLSNSFHRNSIP